MHLERLGDYAQNVYEWIVYLAIGKLKENFVANNTPWIRLDIAGTAYLSKPEGYLPKGATGIHVKTLYNLINCTMFLHELLLHLLVSTLLV